MKRKIKGFLKLVLTCLLIVACVGMLGALFPAADNDELEEGSTTRPPSGSIESNDTTTQVPEEPEEPEEPEAYKAVPDTTLCDIYLDAAALSLSAGTGIGIGSYDLRKSSNNVPYLRIYADDDVYTPASFIFEENSDRLASQYLVFAYRLSDACYGNAVNLRVEEEFGDSYETDITLEYGVGWNVGVLDLCGALAPERSYFNGWYEYSLSCYSFNFGNMLTGGYIDIAYIAFCSDLDDAMQMDADRTGKEFDADDLYEVFRYSGASKQTDGDLDYITLTTADLTTTEYLHCGPSLMLGSGKYVAILYRVDDLPSTHYGELSVMFYQNYDGMDARYTGYFDIGSGWNVMLLEAERMSNPEMYDDFGYTICRYLSFELFLDISGDREYSIDFALIKFFNTEEEARAYFADYTAVNNLTLKTCYE